MTSRFEILLSPEMRRELNATALRLNLSSSDVARVGIQAALEKLRTRSVTDEEAT
jgi:hypothetical protein